VLGKQTRRQLFVAEVVQTSAMDCGPASLKCLLAGFRINASYGRLREACQTDVDGTSIDTMEEVAIQLGLDAEQVLIPLDHLLLPGLEPLPAVIVVRRANNLTHFLVAWRRMGRFMQLMDPAVGRRWLTSRKFLEEVYIHTMPVPAAHWREWAGSPAFTVALKQRLAEVGVRAQTAQHLLKDALADENWRPLAALDAATRMTRAIVRSGAIKRGRQAARVVEHFAIRAGDSEPGAKIPAEFWSAQAAPAAEDGAEQVLLRGAVLVRVRGRIANEHAAQDAKGATKPDDASAASEVQAETQAKTALPPELVAALAEKPTRPGLYLLRILRADGLLTPLVLLFSLAVAAAGTVIEALIFRGLFDIGHELNLSGQRLGAIGALVLFLVALLVLELPVVATVLRMGRRLDTRLRMLFMDKIPRLGDRYFHSRLTSDMTERSHTVFLLRMLPVLGAQFLRLSFSLVLTLLGIIWLDPPSAPLATLAAMLAVAIPLAAQPILVERNLRVRNHAGGLSRFYLDSLIGLFAVRAHAAERAIRRAHENLLIEWASAGLGLQRAVVAVEALQLAAGFGLSAWLVINYVARAGESGGLLLFVYWVMSLPVLGQEIGLIARQYPNFRNVTLRLLEPLGAIEETEADEEMDAQEAIALAESAAMKGAEEDALVQAPPHDSLVVAPQVGEPNGNAGELSAASRGLSVVFANVSVRAAGHTILEQINLRIDAGEHIAIIGSSGAGKSSLVGILLGWHKPADGRVDVGGERLRGRRLEQLRRETAWVDPTVQLWNRTFIENIRYGASTDDAPAINRVLKLADLLDVLERLPDGLQTPLGEGGALVSGGQGQRVRLGRAMLRAHARLVILDEPFRGLERERRRRLLASAREHWRNATLLCITHDVSETRTFPRVVVIHEGRIVEDDHPEQLAARADSRYSALLAAEEEVRTGMWASTEWRRLLLREKHVSESGDVNLIGV